MSMFRSTIIVLLFCSLNLMLVAAAEGQEDSSGSGAEEGQTIRILAVGNSFAIRALAYFPSIASAAGDTVVAGRATGQGWELAQHTRAMDLHEADPTDPKGRPYGDKSLKEMLTSEPWDFVTIQQGSRLSFRPETFQPHVDRLIAYIRQYAPQAEVLIHQTWAYRSDHALFRESEPQDSEPMNVDTMYRGLRVAYDGLAEAKGLRQIPSGDAMEAARRDPQWGPFVRDPSFDPETAEYPDRPREQRSLYPGYKWRTNDEGEHTLGLDAGHTSIHGSYLLGCVWYEFLFDKSVVGNTCTPLASGQETEEVTPEDAAILQRIAHGVVTQGQRPEPR